MNESHLMIIPSLMDANTTIIWEAMAVGLPSMALDHFGFHDTIKNLETGILIKPNYYYQVVKDIAKSLEMLINNKNSLRLMAENVIKVRKHFLWDERVTFFNSIYETAIINYKNK